MPAFERLFSMPFLRGKKLPMYWVGRSVLARFVVVY